MVVLSKIMYKLVLSLSLLFNNLMNIILINFSLKILKSMKSGHPYVVHKLTHSNRVNDQWIPKHSFNIINGAHFLLIQ